MTINIRAASPVDVAVWRALRRDGIVRYPAAFVLSVDEHDATPEQVDAERLNRGDRFLAFDAQTPVGLAGINRHRGRAAHRGEIGPMYVVPEAQGSDAASALLQFILAYADAEGIWQPELTVNEENTRAIAFYRRHGFEQIGRLPNAIIGAAGPEHDLLMIRPQPATGVMPLS
ncbi:MAG: GNAT family N-acetyltransferase [Sulfitobacter sp.]